MSPAGYNIDRKGEEEPKGGGHNDHHLHHPDNHQLVHPQKLQQRRQAGRELKEGGKHELQTHQADGHILPDPDDNVCCKRALRPRLKTEKQDV